MYGEGEGTWKYGWGQSYEGWGAEPETGKSGNVGEALILCGVTQVGKLSFKAGLTGVSCQTGSQFLDSSHLSCQS